MFDCSLVAGIANMTGDFVGGWSKYIHRFVIHDMVVHVDCGIVFGRGSFAHPTAECIMQPTVRFSTIQRNVMMQKLL